jgi:hypothetical protein
MSRNTFTKLQFYDSVISTENALILDHLRASACIFKNFSGLYPGPLFTAGRGNKEGDIWEMGLGRGGGRGGDRMCSPNKILEYNTWIGRSASA